MKGIRFTLLSVLSLTAIVLAACAPAATPAPTQVPIVAPTQAPTQAVAATATEAASSAPTEAASTTPAAEPTVEVPTPAKAYTFGLALSTLNNPFFVSVQNGAQAEAKALGVNIVVADGQNSPTTQASQIEDFITKKVDAILLNPTDSNAVVPSVQKANAANIPVITLDRSAASGNIVTLIASDNVQAGKDAADLLCKAINNTGNVVELQGIAGTSAARDRENGFDTELASACPNVKIVAKRPANFDRATANTVFADILTAQPDIAGVFAQNDEMVLGAIQAAQAANRTGIAFIGIDGTADAITALNNGQLAGDVAQQPEVMGKLAVDYAIKFLAGEKVDSFIPVPLKILTK